MTYQNAMNWLRDQANRNEYYQTTGWTGRIPLLTAPQLRKAIEKGDLTEKIWHKVSANGVLIPESHYFVKLG